MNKWAIAIVSIAAALVAFAAPAAATWNQGGPGSGYGKARALPTGETPTATVSGRNVTVSWSAMGGPVPVTGYVVKRYADGGAEQTIGANCIGTISGLTCTENNVDPGSWQYTVTPARQNWRGNESPRSSAVTVGSPNLTLNTTNYSTLPTTSSGQITNFKSAQTVTFRLDNPTTGTVLSGSITPSPVPSDGTANVSVTIPAGTSNGSHSVYAIGSAGDQASANIAVNTNFVATGSYTGTGADDRAITGVGFTPNVVIVKSLTNQIAIVRTDTMSGDASKPMTGNTALVNDRIQSLDPDGFTLGTDAQVNSNGVSYRWVALRSLNGLLKTGSYTGNGTSQSPAGLGFSPEYVATISAGANGATQRYSGMSRSFGFGADTGSTSAITALNADGFSVGNSATANANGTTYHYFALNQAAGTIDVGTYTGNILDNRNISGLGLSPDWVMLRADDALLAKPSVQRPSSLAGDASLRFDATASAANLIQALQADGFQVGSDGAVNGLLTTYHYLGLENP